MIDCGPSSGDDPLPLSGTHSLAALADHHDRPVSQVDHLVRGAAEHGLSKLAPPPGAHDDDAGVVFLGTFDDFTRRMPEYGLAYLPVGINSRLGQRFDPSPDRLLRLLVRLDRCQPQPAELPLPQVQHPDLSLGQGGQLLGRCDHPRGDLRLVDGDQQSVVHRYAFPLRVRSARSRTPRRPMVPALMPGTVASTGARTQPPSPGYDRAFRNGIHMPAEHSSPGETRDGPRSCARRRRNRLETTVTSAHLG